MGYSVVLVLVKNEGTNNPREIMDEICKYHSSKLAEEKRICGEILESRDEFKKKLPDEIKEFLNSDRKLLYFGLNGEELNKIIGIENDKKANT